MNAFNGASEPDIEEAYLKAEPKILSPASPKPIHFPQPSNIPVLDNMMDVGFNQTEAHMDANSRDTELRPGAWRDPAESDQPSPASTGGNPNGSSAEANDAETSQAEATNSIQALSNGHSTETVQISNGLSYAANSFPRQDDPPSTSTAQEAYAASPNPSVSSSVSERSSTYHTGESEQIFAALQAQSAAETSSAAQPTPFPSSVNVQALLDTLQTSMTPAANVAPTHEGLTAATTQSHSQSQAQPPAPGAIHPSPVAASPSGLPPRPPAQEQPLMNPNYAHSQHIRDYHPHATNPATQTTHAQTLPPHNAANPTEAQSGLFASLGNGANYPTQQSPTSAPVPPPVNQAPAQQYPQQYPPTNAPIESRREYKVAAGETPSSDDQPFPPDIQRKYDHFMEEERRYVNEARWDQFPNNSRLFVGNLSSEKVTKRDIFHVFHSYGELAQISIKQAYGFVQFLRTEDCMRALDAEQGRQIRDKRIHLEISKPQKPSRNQQQQNHGRRSRSPDNRRGSGRYDDRRGGRRDVRESRERDDYYARTSSPPRERDSRYARTYNRRSRSPSYGRGGRYRSPPPEPDDDLPLPRRQPRDVPDVQVIVLDAGLHRDFLSWVEREFSSRSVRVDVLTISQARFDEQAVVRRQIMEGVIAVCKLRRVNQDTSKIGLTIFKRRGGTRDVQFEEYDNLDPSICAELVIRERQSLRTPAAQPTYGGYSGQQYAAPPPPQQYGYQQPPAPYPGPPVGPPVGYPPGYGQPRPTPQFAGQPPVPMLPPGYPPQQPPAPRVDSNNLQNLLSTLNTASPAGPPQQQPYGMPPRPGYPPTQSYQQYPPAPAQSAPAQPPTPGQAPQNMQDILARLSTYRQ